MYQYSGKSKLYLASCHPDIRNVFNTVIKSRDCTIIEGHRPEEKQNEMKVTGRSQLEWPLSNHNKEPSLAVDAAPYFGDRNPHIDWNDRLGFTLFAGFVLGVGARMGVKLRWGGDWKMSHKPNENKFNDLVHFELMEE